MLFTDWLCTGTVIGKLLRQLMLKVSEGDIRLHLQRFLQFVPVIGSRELEGKVVTQHITTTTPPIRTTGSVGFRDDRCNVPAGARATRGGCYGNQLAEIRRGFT